MRAKNSLLRHERQLNQAASALFSFNDMWDCQNECAVGLESESEIVSYYRSFEALVDRIREEDQLDVFVKTKDIAGIARFVPGRDYAIVARCMAFNACSLEMYVLSPDLAEWHKLVREPRFSMLRSLPLRGMRGSAQMVELATSLLSEFRAVITSQRHSKRCHNVGCTSRRRISSMISVIDSAYQASANVDVGFVDLGWRSGCRARKSLDHTNRALASLTNGIRHRAIYSDLLAAILCVELSESKGLHVRALLLFGSNAHENTLEFGRYWSDKCTGGEGSFMSFSDRHVASIFSKWSGLKIEEIFYPSGSEVKHARPIFIEAAVESFARLGLKLRANSSKKHRQLRIMTGELLRGSGSLTAYPWEGKWRVEP